MPKLDPLRYDTTRLRAFRAALGNRSTTPVDILCVGDSMTEGYSASIPSKRWIDRLLAQLRTTYQPAGIVGGEGYVPGFYVSTTMTDRFVLSGSGLPREDLGGLGERTHTLTAINATLTFTFTGTGLDVLYAKGPTAGSVGWKIDAGSETVVNTNAGTISGGNVIQIRGLSAGAHTLVLRNTAGGSVYVEGCYVYNGDETLGVRLWEAGHSGTQTDDIATPNGINWFDSVTPVQPDLVTVFLGLNDYGSNSQPRLTPATVAANLTSIVTQIRAKCTNPPSVLLVLPYERSVLVPPTLATWSEYRTAIEGVAAADGSMALLDLADVIGSFNPSDPFNLDYAGDLLHTNDAGHQMIADAAYEVLTDATYGTGPYGGFFPDELSAVVAYLGDDPGWTPEEIASAYGAEKVAQEAVCDVPDTGRPADLQEALFRRVAHNLGNRALPLGMQATLTETQLLTTGVGGTDAEVARLEAPYGVIPFA